MGRAVVLSEGWGVPDGFGRAHYFVGTSSACGRVLLLFAPPLQLHRPAAAPEDCAACWNALRAGRVV